MTDKLEFIVNAKDRFSGTFGKLTGYLPSIKTLAIGAAGGATALAAGLFAISKNTAEAYDRVQKMSDQLGISTSFLSKYGVAAEFSGVAQETFNKSIQSLQVRMGETAQGLGQSQEAFKALGVSVMDTNGMLKTSETIMPELAEAFHNVTSATEKAEMASKIFGQRGMAMLQMFTNGKEGLADMTAEAEKFGLVISDKAGRNAAMFNDSLTRLMGSFKGIKNHIAEVFMPTFTGMANKFADFIADNREGIVQFAEKFLVAMGGMVEKGAYGVAVLIDAWTGLQMTWEILKIGFAEFSEALWKGIDYLTEKLVSFMETFNVAGIFDSAIASVQNYSGITSDAINEMNRLSAESRENLQELANKGLATDKVDEYADKIKTVMAEIREAGTAPEGGEAESTGIYPFTDANLESTQENMESLRELWDEYMLTDLERLDAWYAEKLNMYKGNQEAQEKIQQIYEKRRSKLKKSSDKDQVSSENWKQQAMYGLQKTGILKGFDLSKAAAIPEIVQSTHTGAISAYKAMAGIHIIGPALGKAAALAVMLYGSARLATVASQTLNVAHGGLDYVPREQTYLLDRGERVLSPAQNRDLAEFMQGDSGGASIVIEKLEINTQENLEGINWVDFGQDKLIPAFSELAKKGIKIRGY